MYHRELINVQTCKNIAYTSSCVGVCVTLNPVQLKIILIRYPVDVKGSAYTEMLSSCANSHNILLRLLGCFFNYFHCSCVCSVSATVPTDMWNDSSHVQPKNGHFHPGVCSDRNQQEW